MVVPGRMPFESQYSAIAMHAIACTSELLDLRVQDRGDPPGNDVDTYPQVLAGLKLAARHAAEPLLDSLLTWRKEALAQAAKPKPEVVILRKRVQTLAIHPRGLGRPLVSVKECICLRICPCLCRPTVCGCNIQLIVRWSRLRPLRSKSFS